MTLRQRVQFNAWILAGVGFSRADVRA